MGRSVCVTTRPAAPPTEYSARSPGKTGAPANANTDSSPTASTPRHPYHWPGTSSDATTQRHQRSNDHVMAQRDLQPHRRMGTSLASRTRPGQREVHRSLPELDRTFKDRSRLLHLIDPAQGSQRRRLALHRSPHRDNTPPSACRHERARLYKHPADGLRSRQVSGMSRHQPWRARNSVTRWCSGAVVTVVISLGGLATAVAPHVVQSSCSDRTSRARTSDRRSLSGAGVACEFSSGVASALASNASSIILLEQMTPDSAGPCGQTAMR